MEVALHNKSLKFGEQWEQLLVIFRQEKMFTPARIFGQMVPKESTEDCIALVNARLLSSVQARNEG